MKMPWNTLVLTNSDMEHHAAELEFSRWAILASGLKTP